MKFSFVIPDSKAFPSGGNIYNAQLVNALKEQGVEVQIIDFERFKIDFDSNRKTLHFIDTLYLQELKDFNKPLTQCFLIVHHLESLDSWKGAVFTETVANEERRILERFDGFLTSSDFTRDYLLSQAFDTKKYIVAPPALSFQPLPKKSSSEKIEGLIVANLIERKGILPFLQALKKSRIQPEDCQIRVAGSLEMEPAYAQECIDFVKLDDRLSGMVHFQGACDQGKIQSLYQQANLFISAAFMETFGMALQEAVAHRLPVLAYDGGNASYHISEGENGYLFDSIETLVFKLEQLCRSKEDFKQLANRAWDFRPYDHYSWKDVADQLINCF